MGKLWKEYTIYELAKTNCFQEEIFFNILRIIDNLINGKYEDINDQKDHLKQYITNIKNENLDQLLLQKRMIFNYFETINLNNDEEERIYILLFKLYITNDDIEKELEFILICFLKCINLRRKDMHDIFNLLSKFHRESQLNGKILDKFLNFISIIFSYKNNDNLTQITNYFSIIPGNGFLMKIPQLLNSKGNDLTKYCSIVFSFKPLHYNQISTIFTAKKNNENQLFLITLDQNNLNFSLKDKQKELIGEIKNEWNNVNIYIDREQNNIYIILNNSTKLKQRIPENNFISEIHLFGNFTGEVSSIFGYFNKGTFGLNREEKHEILFDELKNDLTFAMSFDQHTPEYKQGIYYIEQNEEKKINLIPYSYFIYKDKEISNLNDLNNMYDDYKLRFLISPLLYLNSSLEHKNIICDYYSFFTCNISKIIVNNYEDNKGDINSLGGIGILYPIFLILNNEKIRTVERIDMLLSIIINLIEKENNLKECCENNFWDLICNIFEKWPLDFLNEEKILNKIYLIFILIYPNDELNNLFSFYLPKNKIKLLYMLNSQLLFLFDSNDIEKIISIFSIIFKLINIEIPDLGNNDLIVQIKILYNKIFENFTSDIKYIDEIYLQFLYSYLFFEKKMNNGNNINIEETYLIKLSKELYNTFKSQDYTNYKLDEENESDKILCLYIPILFIIHFVIDEENVLNTIKEKISFLFKKSIKNFFFKNPLLFSLMQNDFQIAENNFNIISPSFINNLCIQFPLKKINLFDYLFEIIKKENEFILENNYNIHTCYGDHFLFVIIISILTLNENNPFFSLFSKISYQYVKQIYKFLFEINGKNKENDEIIFTHKNFIKYHFLLAHKLIQYNNNKIINKKLFNGIFKELLFNESQILKIIYEKEKEIYENEYIINEQYIFNEIKTKHMRKKLIKKLFLYNGYWADSSLFFFDDEENEENKIKTSQFKYKIKNFITNDFKKPILTPIIDIDEYIENFPKDNNNENINNQNDFYKKFNWFNHINNEEKTPFKKFIDEIINLLITKDKKNIMLKYVLKIIDKENKYIYNPRLIKNGYEIQTLFYFSKELDEYKINIYTLDDNNNQHINDMNFYFEILPCLNKAKNNLIQFKIKNIMMFFSRIYNYKKSGLELFLSNGKNYYLVFNETEILKKIIIDLTEKINNTLENKIFFYKIINDCNDINFGLDKNQKKISDSYIIGYISQKYINLNNLSDCVKDITKLNEKIFLLSKLIEKWKDNHLSNYVMLMYLNIFSNRSFSDISQYPIFPWTLYQSIDNDMKKKKNSKNEEKENNFEELLRDLSKPMGQVLNNDRTQNFKSMIQKKKQNELNKIYLYHTNYSNLTYVSNYLIRLYPFTFIFKECQKKKLVNNEEEFTSIQKSFFNATNEENDFREIIPEFFYLYQMFQNINKIPNLKDVQLYEGTDNIEQIKPYFEYCNKLKYNLESKEVSKNLNEWIDLIFGDSQKGEKARKKINCFKIESYIDVSNNNLKYCENREILENIYKNGLIPLQLFKKNKFIQKNYKIVNHSPFHAAALESSNKIDGINQIIHFENSNFFYMENFNTSNYIFYNYHLCFTYKPKSIISSSVIKKNFLMFYGGKILRDYPLIDTKFKEQYGNHAIYIKNNIYYSFNGGFFNGNIQCLSVNNNKIELIKICFKNNIYQNTISPYITSLEIINNEDLLIAGDSKGNIQIFQISQITENSITLNNIQTLYDHLNEIIYINYNNDLNLLISVSKDGYINLYKINPFECIHSYKSPYKEIKFVSLISNPIPSIIVYASQYLFTILLNEFCIHEKTQFISLSNPRIIKSPNHEEFLMFTNEKNIFIYNPFDLSKEIKHISFEYNILSYCFSTKVGQVYGLCQNNNKDYYIEIMKGK